MEFRAKEPQTIKVILPGGEYQLRRPKMFEQLELDKAVKQEGTDHLVVMLEWLVALGLPKDVALNLDQDTFMDLCLFVSGSKKN